MRIAVLTWTDRRAGGVETYLEAVLPALAATGQDVSLWHEVSEPEDRPAIALPPSIERRACGDRGAAIGALGSWNPDVVVSNGLADARLELDLTGVAPLVLVAHNYHGTCISGTKCWSVPVRQPCSRTFGVACLALYYPRRCGGLSPITMTRLYARSRLRLRAARRCRRVVALSAHMRDEYVRHGLDASAVVVVPYGPQPHSLASAPAQRSDSSIRLVTVGRLESLKGNDLLIDALPAVQRSLGRPVVLTLVGHGPARPRLEAQAAAVQAAHGGVSVRFMGWLDSADRDVEIARADLLVMPSVWPEPFGISGLDAAHLGVPAVAFAVGGIADWLVDGETGRLAPAAPPTSEGLAAAIVSVLGDPKRHEAMRRQARSVAATRSPARHAAELAAVLSTALRAPLVSTG